MTHVAVHPIRCTGHGLCAALLPEALHLDEWGYPRVVADTLPAGLLRRARQTAAACPTRALRLSGDG